MTFAPLSDEDGFLRRSEFDGNDAEDENEDEELEELYEELEEQFEDEDKPPMEVDLGSVQEV